MAGIFDVPAGRLIEEVAADLKKQGVQAPGWMKYVKTGISKERVPNNKDWFHVRAGSILYRVLKDGPVGTGSLRTYYGGRKNRGTKKEHFYKASGKIIRVCLQALEKQGWIKKDKKGRALTPKGQSYLLKKAKEVSVLIEEDEKKGAIAKEEKKLRMLAAEEEAAHKAGDELRRMEAAQKGKGKEKGREKPEKKEKQEGTAA